MTDVDLRAAVRSARRGVGLLLLAAALTVLVVVLPRLNSCFSGLGGQDGGPAPTPTPTVTAYAVVLSPALGTFPPST